VLDAEIGGVLKRVRRLLGSIGGGEIRELLTHYVGIIALFDRSRNLFAAIHVLLREGFPHEAMILARPLLTDSLALQELAAADEERRRSL
jgi:hypothetical protein